MSTAIHEVAPVAQRAEKSAERPVTTILLPFEQAAIEAMDASFVLSAIARGVLTPRHLGSELQHIRDGMVQALNPDHGMVGAVAGARSNALFGKGGELLRTSLEAIDPELNRLDAAAGEAGLRHRQTFGLLAKSSDSAMREASALESGGLPPMGIYHRFERLAQDQDAVAKGWGGTMRALAYLSASEQLLKAGAGEPSDDRIQKSIGASASEFASASRELSITSRFQPRVDGEGDGQTAKHLAGAGTQYDMAWERTLAGAQLWGAALAKLQR